MKTEENLERMETDKEGIKLNIYLNDNDKETIRQNIYINDNKQSPYNSVIPNILKYNNSNSYSYISTRNNSVLRNNSSSKLSDLSKFSTKNNINNRNSSKISGSTNFLSVIKPSKILYNPRRPQYLSIQNKPPASLSVVEEDILFKKMFDSVSPGPGYYESCLSILDKNENLMGKMREKFQNFDTFGKLPYQKYEEKVREKRKERKEGGEEGKEESKEVEGAREKKRIMLTKLKLRPSLHPNSIITPPVNNSPSPSPFSYYIPSSFDKITIKPHSTSMAQRFAPIFPMIKTPSPGQYDPILPQSFKNYRNLRENAYLKAIYKNERKKKVQRSASMGDMEVVWEKRGECGVPGVGMYNPSLSRDIEYMAYVNMQSNLNKIVPFGSSEKRFRLPKSSTSSKIGPGPYDVEAQKNFEIERKIEGNWRRNKKEEEHFWRLEEFLEGEKEYAGGRGPGAYELDCYENWNKRSFNVLFN